MARLNPFLLRLSRWPRRIAALVCLLLAAATALAPANDSAAAPKRTGNPIANALRAGQVAVPLTVTSARAAAFVRAGDRVGVFTAPSDTTFGAAAAGETAPSETDRASPVLVADGLRVLAAAAADATMSADAPVIVVAADKPTAARLAAVANGPLLVVVDKSP